MSTVKSRLKEVMDALGLDRFTPASTCEGITKNMMQKLWNSDTGVVTSNILEPFAKRYTNVNCNYIIRGEGEMFLGIEKDTTEAPNKYLEICKMLLDNRKKDAELYLRLADMMDKEPK